MLRAPHPGLPSYSPPLAFAGGQVYRPRKASDIDMAAFHSEDYIEFLKRVTPETKVPTLLFILLDDRIRPHWLHNPGRPVPPGSFSLSVSFELPH